MSKINKASFSKKIRSVLTQSCPGHCKHMLSAVLPASAEISLKILGLSPPLIISETLISEVKHRFSIRKIERLVNFVLCDHKFLIWLHESEAAPRTKKYSCLLNSAHAAAGNSLPLLDRGYLQGCNLIPRAWAIRSEASTHMGRGNQYSSIYWCIFL